MAPRNDGAQQSFGLHAPSSPLRSVLTHLQRRSPFFVSGFCLSFLSIVIFNTRVFAQSGTTVTVSPTTTQLSDVVVDDTATNSASVTLTATASPDPGGLSWTWSGPSGGSGTAVLSSTGPSNSTTATIYFTTPGAQNWQVSASGSGTDSSGPTSAGPGSATISVNVISVESISLKSGVKHTIGHTLTKSDFTITTNPPGFESMVTLPSVDLAEVGDKTVVATCGTSSAQTTVNVPQWVASGSFGSADFESTSVTIPYTVELDNADGSYYFTANGASTGGGGSLYDEVPVSGNLSGGGFATLDQHSPAASQNVTLAYGMGGISHFANPHGPWAVPPEPVTTSVEVYALVVAIIALGVAIYQVVTTKTVTTTAPGGLPALSTATPISNTYRFGDGASATYSASLTTSAGGSGYYEDGAFKKAIAQSAQVTMGAPSPTSVADGSGFDYAVYTKANVATAAVTRAPRAGCFSGKLYGDSNIKMRAGFGAIGLCGAGNDVINLAGTESLTNCSFQW